MQGHHFLFSHLTMWSFISVGGVCNFLGSVSLQQKFEAMDRPVLQLSDRPVLQLSFIQKIKENKCLRQEGMLTQKTKREARPPTQLWLLFLYVFSPLPGPALCKLGQPGVLFVLPEVLTPLLGPSFVLFSWAYPFLSFSHHHSELPFPILTT